MLFNIFVQTIGAIGTIFYFLSFQFRENKKLFRVQVVSYFFYVIHFLLLKAYTGGLSYIVGLLKSIFLSSDNKKLHSSAACVFLCVIQITVGIITYRNFISILPIIANVAALIAGYSYNPKLIRLIGIYINSPLWIIHNYVVGSWVGIIDELITELSMIVSLIRYKFKKEI